ncbi:RraA family protein [Microbacterium betulae]|uniref:Putative 4-hydroxy-4-methyl-2-oxoglutarate aldolase n=1 Tax=Microbacterium betulae TaxID=2981139 RepID=A0AA97I691_9MICO|nr:RraA family protein [Microbacterium sp. AB]WOF22902.1 RraA family protein [Microbacterium sp. AB]
MSDPAARRRRLLSGLDDVELATIGHLCEEGFCAPRIRRVAPAGRMAGVAVTVDLVEPDAIAVNRALVGLAHGEVLVVRVRGGRHAPVGAVTVAAAVARGAAGIVVDGPVTDLSALAASGLPVYATGTTALTTKAIGSSAATSGGTVEIGGVLVRPGDVVAGDENGVVVLDPERFDPGVLDAARRADEREPDLLRRIAGGDPLAELLALGPRREGIGR